jgi:hypothetical protein
MAINKTRIDADKLYRCVEPLSFVDPEGLPHEVNRETVLLGSNPVVQQYPHVFAPEGNPQAQAAARFALYDPEEIRASRRMSQQSGIQILETRMKAKRAVKLDVDGQERRVKKGELLDPSELICSLVPSAFERVSAEQNR